ncbi:MAG: tetratricopeptide repeat protein [Candidatus Rokubacteria bacterium]|nr:tetratricopeptide repeat protein [Candidatus Rokubacteria bacterium]
MKVLGELPESRDTLAEALEIRIALGPALIAIKGANAPEVEASYLHARELCDRLEDTSRLFPVLWGLWYASYSQGRYRNSQEIGERLLSVAREGRDSALLVEAHHTLWATLVGMGNAVAAQAHLKQGLVLYDRQQHRSLAFLYGAHDPGVCCRNVSAMASWQLGYPDQALKSMLEALSLARELSHPLTTVIALYFAAWVLYHLGDHEAAREKAETLVALATPQGFSTWAEDASIFVARTIVERGRGEDRVAQVHRGLTPSRAAGRAWRDAFCLCLLADAYGRVGQPEEGLRVLLAIAPESAGGFYAAELHRIKGELLLKQGADVAQEAATCFRRAIEIACDRQEKSFELRAAMSLSRLLRRQGKREDAQRILTEIYRWFGEGSDTRDLKEAKALLDEL